MHIHYNTSQTTLPLEISSFLPHDHLVFTIEKGWIPWKSIISTSSIMTLVTRLITLKCFYLLFYLLIHKEFSVNEKLKNDWKSRYAVPNRTVGCHLNAPSIGFESLGGWKNSFWFFYRSQFSFKNGKVSNFRSFVYWRE